MDNVVITRFLASFSSEGGGEETPAWKKELGVGVGGWTQVVGTLSSVFKYHLYHLKLSSTGVKKGGDRKPQLFLQEGGLSPSHRGDVHS